MDKILELVHKASFVLFVTSIVLIVYNFRGYSFYDMLSVISLMFVFSYMIIIAFAVTTHLLVVYVRLVIKKNKERRG